MAAEIIPLYRVKTIAYEADDKRFELLEKAPPKGLEAMNVRPPSKFAGRELDALQGTAQAKFAHRSCKSSKLRFFRVFKLLTAAKREELAEARYRPLAERLRLQRWMRRL